MQKCYIRTEWENVPSKKSPVNEDNLNKLEYGLDAIDTRVCELAGYEERAAEAAAEAERFKTACGDFESAAKKAASQAGDFKDQTDASAAAAESYAAGGTGSRAGEETDNAKYYKEQAGYAKDAALLSADNAKESERSAEQSRTDAANCLTQAAASAEGAAESAAAARTKAAEAAVSATNSASSASNAQTAVSNAQAAAVNAQAGAKTAESYACGGTNTRAGEEKDNAKYYKEQAERISGGLKGALLPMGTISFSELPNTSNAGYMYNISNEFTTTDRFKEGAGNIIPAGSNVYYTADGYWDCMAGSPVTGIKGAAETTFRRGNVSITPANLGLGNVPNVSTNDQTPTYTRQTTRTNLTSGEKLTTAFGKIQKWFSDLKTGAFSTVANNDTTTASGYIADARVVKQHGDEIDALNETFAKQLAEINSSLAKMGTAETLLQTTGDAMRHTKSINLIKYKRIHIELTNSDYGQCYGSMDLPAYVFNCAKEYRIYIPSNTEYYISIFCVGSINGFDYFGSSINTGIIVQGIY